MKIIAIIAALVLLLTIVSADTCGGNCPSNDCSSSSCVCGRTPHYIDINSWCAQYGWNQACCRCIVSHESSGNANAINQNVGGSLDVGVAQINTQNWAQCNGGHPPCDTVQNLNCAIKVYLWGGSTFRLWSTCQGCSSVCNCNGDPNWVEQLE